MTCPASQTRAYVALFCLIGIPGSLYAQCEPQWTPGFHLPGVNRGLNSEPVHALIEYDDGSGPALFAGGDFTAAGPIPANSVAKWSPATFDWTSLGSGLGGSFPIVYAFEVFDAGSGNGPDLYVAGKFESAGGISTKSIARWDGKSWAALPGFTSLPKLNAMAVFNDGSGDALYVGGVFFDVGGQTVNHIARWDGKNWSGLAGGLDGGIAALTVFDDGTGPALYAAGTFSFAGGVPCNNIAKWNGIAWSPLGAGISHPPPFVPDVSALAVYDDGSLKGPSLYAGGNFSMAGGLEAIAIARWDGVSWSSVGGGMGGISFPRVESLQVFNDGTGEKLYVGGLFATAGGIEADHIASWDGTAWSSVGGGTTGTVYSMTALGGSKGGMPLLVAGGTFSIAGDAAASRVALWDGSTWSALNQGKGISFDVIALAACDECPDGGSALYAGGGFGTAGGVPAIRVARWDGSSWHPLGSGMDDSVWALACYNEGSGPMLYAGGSFTMAGGFPIQGLARWDGATWSNVGGGIDGTANAFAVYDDGNGPALYVAGNFTTAGGVSASKIAKWDGRTWSPLGLGTSSSASALAVFDDGINGPALYAGGNFSLAGGMTVNHIAKWDGVSWSSLAGGTDEGVHAMTVFDVDGPGPNPPGLFAGGSFSEAGGVPANRLAKWDGVSWASIATVVRGGIRALEVFDDSSGGGPALYVGRRSTGQPDLITKWNGFSWSSLGSGVDGDGPLAVEALAAFDDDSMGPIAPALFVGGQFDFAGGIPSNRIARWGAPGPVCFGDIAPDCGDGVVNIGDLLLVIARWGSAGGQADVNKDGLVNVGDLLAVIAAWGPCP